MLLDSDQRQYAWGERAALIRKTHMRYPELSQSDIAERVGCTPQNVSQVLSAFLVDRSYDDLEEYRNNKAECFEALQYRTLASITNDDIDKAPLMARITGAAILQDKIALMRGQPTNISVTALLDVAEAIRARRK